MEDISTANISVSDDAKARASEEIFAILRKVNAKLASAIQTAIAEAVEDVRSDVEGLRECLGDLEREVYRAKHR